jgi:hypothetical protein
MTSRIVRNSAAIQNYLREHPEVQQGKVLSGNYLVLYTEDANVQNVIPSLGNTKIDAYSLVVGLMGAEALSAAGITSIQQQPYLDLRGQGVLLGFVDTGIDFTKDAFKYEDGTSKIQFVWDQTINGVGADTETQDGNKGANDGRNDAINSAAPVGYGFGTEFTNAQINAALKESNPFASVPHRDTAGHGTYLASVAASRESGENAGAAPDAEIIAVKLRRVSPFYTDVFVVPPDQENAFESIDVMLGIEYIIEKANALGRPVAICLSVGTNQAGHDGFSLFEEYLARISHQAGVVLCCAAGNEANTGHHTSGTIAKTDDDIKIEINAGSKSSDIYLHILNNASDRLSVSVSSPTGELVGRVPAVNGTVSTTQLIFEKSKVIIYYFFPVEGSGSQITVIKILDATPGLWTVLVHGDIIINGKYDAWLPVTGFTDPDVKFMTPVPDCTIVVPATAAGVITCGATNAADKSLYASSSWGPTRLPALMPDLTAPGVNVTGAFPLGYGKSDGTSTAAAVAAGACALLLQWGVVNRNEPIMDTYLARANLIRGCERDAGVTYPNDQSGYGRLNLQRTFEMLRVN